MPCLCGVVFFIFYFSCVWFWNLIIARFTYSSNQGTPAHYSSFVMPQKGVTSKMARHTARVLLLEPFLWNWIHVESSHCHIMGNISHLEEEMVKAIVAMSARARVCTVSAGCRGDRRRQICHWILKFAFYKCIQKVTVLLLGCSLTHLNLIITALCKIWDSQGPAGWRAEVATCSFCWLDSSSYTAETAIEYIRSNQVEISVRLSRSYSSICQ